MKVGSNQSLAIVLTGVNSGCTFTVSKVIITNSGLFSDGTAQGFIEYSAITNIPFVRETFQISGTDSVRFVHWGDWRLSDSTEMGDAVISDLEEAERVERELKENAAATQKAKKQQQIIKDTLLNTLTG